jgi:phage replication-related protein YjqB (UPF0714/DUF867 family)
MNVCVEFATAPYTFRIVKIDNFDFISTIDNPCDRRAFLRMIGAAALPLVANGCNADDSIHRDESGQFRDVNLEANVAVSVQQAKANQAIASRQELISIDTDLTTYLALGDQCRIRRGNSNVALYTVGELRHEGGNNRVRMGWQARAKLGTTSTFAATLQTKVVANLTDAQAQAQSEFVERLVDDGVSTSLVAVAPHGGFIEQYTDDQAALVRSLLAGKKASSWLCKGYKQGGGAYDRWHITSTDLSPNSFPGLDAIADRGFTYAVSFHGMSLDLVLVGGGAPLPLKQLVHAAIADVLQGSDIEVSIANATDQYAGDSPDNVVNWLTADGLGGIQIEQSLRARALYGPDIAAAIADVFDKLL